jgi:hypothetical protein
MANTDKNKKDKEKKTSKKVVLHYFYYIKPNGAMGLKNKYEVE